MRFGEHIDSFLTQVTKELTRKGALLGLTLTNVVNVKAGDNLDCNDHEMEEFKILRGCSKAKKQGHIPGLQERQLFPLPEPAWKGPIKRGLLERKVHESCSILKYHLFQTQELPILTCRKPGKNAKKPPWKNLVAKLRRKKEAHREWKQGQVIQDKYRYIQI